MKRKLYLDFSKLMLLVLLSGHVWTLNAGIVKGVIKDRKDKEPLAGATVMASAYDKGTAAGRAGFTVWNCPPEPIR